MYVIDFEFEREVPDDGGERVLRSGIKVSEDHQPPDKKSKADMIPEKRGSNEDDTVAVHNSRLSQSTGKQVSSEVWSAPPKINYKSRSQIKLMANAQKAYKNSQIEDNGGRVHIPETFEDSDSDSDSFTQKIAMLTDDEVGQSSKQGGLGAGKQVWFVETESLDKMDVDFPVSKRAFDCSGGGLPSSDKLLDVSEVIPIDTSADLATGAKESKSAMSLSPEIFIPDDHIVNTQESVGIDEMQDNADVSALIPMNNNSKSSQQVPEKRRSERLKKDTA
jgi:hypothetical protein